MACSKTEQKFTWATVTHQSTKACPWIVIHNGVYDVTEFLSEHPGGAEILLEMAGKDATEAFEELGHSDEARKLMKNYKIGEITDGIDITIREVSDFMNPRSCKFWILPISLCILSTAIYRYYLQSQ